MTDEEERLEKRAEEYANKIEKELLKDYESREYGTTPYLATIPTPYNKQAFIDGYKECEKDYSAEIDVLKRELQAEKNMRQYLHDEYCKAVNKK